MSGIILGDSGYPNLPWLLTAYLHPNNEQQGSYNRHICHTRVIIEQAFGRWKRRFGCLFYLRNRIDIVCFVIGATIILHNIATQRNLPDFDDYVEDNPIDDVPNNEEENNPNNNLLRNRIVETYFNN
jgi:hypothetical protein